MGTQQSDGTSKRVSVRRDHRFPYAAVQRVAPHDGQMWPDDERFRSVQFFDLSRGGCAFFYPAEPDFESVAITFVAAGKAIKLFANVRHYRPAECSDKSDWIVGCQFSQRISEEHVRGAAKK